MGARMYFSESSRRDMQVSQEEFSRNWDLAFGKKEEKAPKLIQLVWGPGERCSSCTNECFYLINKNICDIILREPSARVEYYGYCTVKKSVVFKLVCGDLGASGMCDKFTITGDEIVRHGVAGKDDLVEFADWHKIYSQVHTLIKSNVFDRMFKNEQVKTIK